MKIYYEKHGNKIGPKSITDLDPLELKRDTLVWFEGQTNWIKANEIAELADYFKTSPPPLPTSPRISINEKYDRTYKRETDAIGIGLTLFIFPLFLMFVGAFNYETEKSYAIGRSIFTLVGLLIRIFVCIYVVNIAKRQNRNSTVWGVFSFIIPSISLIIIGFLKRLKVEGQPTYEELTSDKRTPDEKQIDDEKFERSNNILRMVSFSLIAIGFIALIILFLTE